MAFRLDLAHDPGDEVRRMLLQQLARARKVLTRDEPSAAVHEARKCFKRARALVRLIRPAIGKVRSREANATLRDLGRHLSGARDADVLAETIAYVAANGDDIGPAHVRGVRALISRTRPSGDGPGRDDVLGGIDAAVAELDALPFDAVGRRSLIKGFVRAYAKGCDLVPVAYADGHDETFHDLRKAVQAHWRHCGILRELWPEAMAVRIDAARDLSQIIGIDHDLSVLAAFVAAADGRELTAAGKAKIVSGCRRLQGEQRAAARPVALRLFADSARGMSDWVEALWSNDAVRRPAKDAATTREDVLSPN